MASITILGRRNVGGVQPHCATTAVAPPARASCTARRSVPAMASRSAADVNRAVMDGERASGQSRHADSAAADRVVGAVSRAVTRA